VLVEGGKMSKKTQILYAEPRRLLSVEETSQRLGISPQTIYNSISRKSDRHFPLRPKRWGKKVLFDSKDVAELIDQLPYADEVTDA
jgi:predicted DNA-binding transcriptional regulator AlpA